MNSILFEADEIGKPLLPGDKRTVHLLKTLHKKIGDSFAAGVFEGFVGTGRIDEITPEGLLFYSLDATIPPPPRIPVRLGVGFPRPIQLRRLLRDMATLGIEGVDLFGTALGEKSYRETKLLEDGGARAACIEGAIQARDTRIPEIRVYPGLSRWLEEAPWGDGAGRIALDNIRPRGSFAEADRQSGLVLAVGSERGWSDQERFCLEEAGFQRLALGSRPLRTETACIAGVILAMEKLGLMGIPPRGLTSGV
ncbi:MAG: RNA methyltransferase [Spirochaetaceae bacterium]|jgi:RsmE family RNA methyltransferase|nr:RNA methyltransferase [Spirochaetaceae bacterium]